MSLKINPLVATLLIAGILILLFALFKGCHTNRQLVAENISLTNTNKQLLSANDSSKKWYDSSKKDFQDSLEFERGQKALVQAQKERTESDLDKALLENSKLYQKYKNNQYTDTTTVSAPREFIDDCQTCFGRLEKDSLLIRRYQTDINNLEASNERQNKIYQKQFKALDQEKLGFYNKIQSLAQQQRKELDKLKPHGRLYLSWAVLFKPLPIGGGAGLLYQNKYNLILGARYYYTTYGPMVETSLNFPLSLKFR